MNLIIYNGLYKIMSLLPDIGENGELVLSKEDVLLKKMFDRDFVDPERKVKLKEEIERLKANKMEEELKAVDQNMSQMNREPIQDENES